jgi:hypothetical protein
VQREKWPTWFVYSQALLRFLLEVCAIVLLAVWGFTAVGPWWAKVVLGVGAPAVAIALWARFVAPRARRFLPLPGRLLVELVIFGAATLVLWSKTGALVAIVFAVAAVINSVLVHLDRQDERLRQTGAL